MNLGIMIPSTYAEWKRRICNIYDKEAFDKISYVDKPKNQSARSSKGTSSVTSSVADKSMSKGSSGSGWTTYGGAREPMDIDRLKKEGRCFNCRGKGHLGKDCKNLKWPRDPKSGRYMTAQLCAMLTESEEHDKEEKGHSHEKVEEKMPSTSKVQELHSLSSRNTAFITSPETTPKESQPIQAPPERTYKIPQKRKGPHPSPPLTLSIPELLTIQDLQTRWGLEFIRTMSGISQSLGTKEVLPELAEPVIAEWRQQDKGGDMGSMPADSVHNDSPHARGQSQKHNDEPKLPWQWQHQT
ncbi:hypothetical protein IW262DRAFT_1469533 [Armillaria fumosa]|nr:hypothetical protein IW262DRAFT_1469533 [Armillaria fumosa]